MEIASETELKYDVPDGFELPDLAGEPGQAGAQVQRRPIPPHPAPHPGHLGSGLMLGRPVTLVQAQNRAPVARIAAPVTAGEGSPVALDAAGSFDFDGDAVSHAWSFGDGGVGAGPLVSHAYEDNGVFTLGLSVTDPSGEVGSASRPIACP